jgi:hypothetical protein
LKKICTHTLTKLHHRHPQSNALIELKIHRQSVDDEEKHQQQQCVFLATRCSEIIAFQIYYEVRFAKKTHFSGERRRKSIELIFLTLFWHSSIELEIFKRDFTVIYDSRD